MKKTLLNTVLFLIFTPLFLGFTQPTEKEDKTEYLIAFAKAYGYVKYFHPSDEAYDLDWNGFAVYASEQMLQCRNDQDALKTLNRLFQPLAPSVQFSETKIGLDTISHIPKNPKRYKSTYWQHRGLGYQVQYENGVYKSSRVNRPFTKAKGGGTGNIMTSFSAEKHAGKPFRYSASIKMVNNTNGYGKLWLRTDHKDKTYRLFNAIEGNVITAKSFQRFQIEGKIHDSVQKINVGAYLVGKGKMLVDSVILEVKTESGWESIAIHNQNFEEEGITKGNSKTWFARGAYGYRFGVEKNNYQGDKCAFIERKSRTKKARKKFKKQPEEGEIFVTSISENLFCSVPLSLYFNKEGTFPKANSLLLNELKTAIEGVSKNPKNPAFRIGNVINTFNVFQHFYPYFDVVKVDWDKELVSAIYQSFTDQTEEDHLNTLRRFTAKLKDAHIYVSGSYKPLYFPAFYCEWLNQKLIITHVLDPEIGIVPGDIISHLNTVPADKYYQSHRELISAGNKRFINHIATRTVLGGDENTTLEITVNGVSYSFNRKYGYQEMNKVIVRSPHFKWINDSIAYINLDKISRDHLKKRVKELKNAHGIICDLRGYPNNNDFIIRHFFNGKDTCKSWMKVPQNIYPNQREMEWNKGYSWGFWRLGMQPKKPYLGDKNVVFITDESAISWSESILGMVKGYQLATIVGQPTAGANGNINPFTIAGGYSISWTGMKVTRLNGEQHHTIGVLPDVYVTRTITGIKEDRDEFLEKALQIVQ